MLRYSPAPSPTYKSGNSFSIDLEWEAWREGEDTGVGRTWWGGEDTGVGRTWWRRGGHRGGAEHGGERRTQGWAGHGGEGEDTGVWQNMVGRGGEDPRDGRTLHGNEKTGVEG